MILIVMIEERLNVTLVLLILSMIALAYTYHTTVPIVKTQVLGCIIYSKMSPLKY